MNIYLHIEILIRELDANLLLAVLAANKNHEVLITDISNFESAFKRNLINPGIFHTKSLTPNNWKISKHKEMIEKGFIITSNDQEAGLSDHGYEYFSKTRYSDISIEQASAVFGWGQDDVEELKKIYPKQSSKIFKTGSPRSDLLRDLFYDYWGKTTQIKKPFLLVPSNMGLCDKINFPDRIKFLRKANYNLRDPNAIKKEFRMKSDEYRRGYAFIEAMEYIAKNNNDLFDIVFRPHPTENIDCWKIYLEGIPNLHVIREGSITKWINNSFAVMHNGCTTAIEAAVSGKPVITYDPFNPPMILGKFANEIGYKVKNVSELLNIVKKIFQNNRKPNDLEQINKDKEKIQKKIYIDENELASNKIITIWEKIFQKYSFESQDWVKLKYFFILRNIKNYFFHKIKNLLNSNFEKKLNENKFPSNVNKLDIVNRINKLKKVLKIDDKIGCKFISNRTILIRKIK